MTITDRAIAEWHRVSVVTEPSTFYLRKRSRNGHRFSVDFATHTSGKRGFLTDDSCEEWRSRRSYGWNTLSFCILAVLLAVACCMFLAIFLFSMHHEDVTTELLNTLADLHVPPVHVPDIRVPPSADVDARAPAATIPARPSRRLAPPRGRADGGCDSQVCRYVAQWLRANLDMTKDPCVDFYDYVCGSFEGLSQLSNVEQETKLLNIKFLNETVVPPTNQNAAQKVSGLYQTCMSFVQGDRNETADLVTWMQSLNLDLIDETKLAQVVPVDMIVRCSLDLGVPAVVSFEMLDTLFEQGKRGMKVKYSTKQAEWLEQHGSQDDEVNVRYYSSLLRRYGVQSPRDDELAASIYDYEGKLQLNVDKVILVNAPTISVGIRYFGTYTRPYVTSDDWAECISKYTNNTYKREDSLILQQNVLSLIANLLNDTSVGEKGLRYLVAWSVYTQLYYYTLPRRLVGRDTQSEACYEHAGRAMRLARTSPYFQSEPFPDVPQDRLFPSWIKSVSLSAHQKWADQTTFLFDDTVVNAHYEPDINIIVIPTGIITRPLYYNEAPEALNYGGLAMLRRRGRQQEDELDHYIDSENLADLVGVNLAYKAFSSLPQAQHGLTLKGLNMSSDGLFFVNHCVKMCREYSVQEGAHAPGHSRCNVPLMNMPEFSSAFNCAPGEPMNPAKKCAFW
ncbi:hypothetical protein HPB50_002438 [Hyalomma asiaticum]|uniref:Uncharacterized protein n=1 Tax=Hyalomma asiaticum TaxID=266040 RepID=A0ACB7SH59_HYAAI|nr:hypothetical protein HPB50_002438 [Hyalomma asiaticum]